MSELNIHEDLRRENEVIIGTERSFGFVFALVFSLIGYFVLGVDNSFGVGTLVIGVIFLLIGIACPKLLRPLNIFWFKFGMLLSRFMHPIIMGILFFTSIVPMGLIMRLTNRDPLRLKPNPTAETYWIKRNPPGPSPISMKNQF
ncbi:MAG: hypothetical protein CFH06_01670, partial [Alphaproteobacteria bacterium MarineAlpha3_Bin5]|tara:strand:+ start:465 stop:896 length:432 start_codon:yes stop_codon:yes gene_type:complete